MKKLSHEEASRILSQAEDTGTSYLGDTPETGPYGCYAEVAVGMGFTGDEYFAAWPERAKAIDRAVSDLGTDDVAHSAEDALAVLRKAGLV